MRKAIITAQNHQWLQENQEVTIIPAPATCWSAPQGGFHATDKNGHTWVVFDNEFQYL